MRERATLREADGILKRWGICRFSPILLFLIFILLFAASTVDRELRISLGLVSFPAPSGIDL